MSEKVDPWPYFGPDEISAVDAVLAGGNVNYWTGQETRSFEREYAKFLGVRYAVALANGTVALELPLRVWGIQNDDEVIVTPRSFIASASCVVLQGALPVFADVDRDSGNLTAATIEKVMTPRTRAIVLVHLAGWPCEMDDILAITKPLGIRILEDCAQAHGAAYRGHQVGSIGDVGAFSFCQDKIITTGGEGGMLATNDEDMWLRAWAFKDHGKNYKSVQEMKNSKTFRWLHDSFGTNWRMTELQGAIGRIQLSKLSAWSERRRANAQVLMDGLSSVPGLRVPRPPAHVSHGYYRFYAYVEINRLRSQWSRERIIGEISEQGVPCFSGSCSEIYLEKAFESTPYRPATPLPVARELGATSLALLVHPTLHLNAMHRTVEVISDTMRRAIA